MADESNGTLDEPPFHEILTERLRLRTLRVADAGRMLPILSLDEVMKWTSVGPATNISRAERWLKDRVLGQDVFHFAIELKQTESNHETDRTIIGSVGSFHLPKVGYLIHPDFAGNGYATESLQAIIPQLFDRMPHASPDHQSLGFDYLEGWVNTDNWASRRVLEKCGFTICETLRVEDLKRHGHSLEVTIYRIARPGMTLDQLGLLASEVSQEDSAPEPPVQ